MKEYHPIVHEPHSMRWSNLERNLYLAFIAVLLLSGFISFKLEMRERARASKQTQLEQQALANRHAVEIRP